MGSASDRWRALRASPGSPDPIRFCLDENLSYRVADALQIVGVHILHVSKVPGLAGQITGHSGADDPTVARWCATTSHILITCDSDFRARWVRTGLLAKEGAEVIVFKWQVSGLQEQHREITTRLPSWTDSLTRVQRGHRVWIQAKRGPLYEQRQK